MSLPVARRRRRFILCCCRASLGMPEREARGFLRDMLLSIDDSHLADRIRSALWAGDLAEQIGLLAQAHFQ